MKLLAAILLFVFLFCSCAPVRFAGVKKEKISDLSVQWIYGQRVNDIYISPK